MTDRTRRETKLGLPGADGLAALEMIVEGVRRSSPNMSSKELAADLWPHFKTAVAAAIADNADDHAAAGRRWSDARHS